jgi:hypothetical protein
MSSQSVAATPAASVSAPVSRARLMIVISALALSSAAVAAVVLWHPWPERDDFSYGATAASRDATWVAMLISGLGYAIAAVTLSLAVGLLVRGRGAGWANLGAVLTTVGGVLFGSAGYGIAVLAWYATATEAIPAGSGAALLTYVENNAARAFAPTIAGFLAFHVGVLVLAVALWRARTAPRWLPIVMAVAVLAQFAAPTDRILDVVQAAVMVTFIAVAWYALRAGVRDR